MQRHKTLGLLRSFALDIDKRCTRIMVAFLSPVLALLLACLVRGFFSSDGIAPFFGMMDEQYLAALRLLRSPASAGELFSGIPEETGRLVLSLAASPFNWLVALFPIGAVTHAVSLTMLLRAGLSGVSFALLLGAGKREARSSSVLFSTLYALSSYAVVTAYSPLFADTCLLFPLILLGILRLQAFGKPLLFSAALALAALTNPLAFPQILLVSLVFSIFLAMTEHRRIRPFPVLLLSLGASLIAIFTAALVLFPILMHAVPQLEGHGFQQIASLLDLFAKMLPGSYDGTADQHFPYLFIGMLPLLLIPSYFTSTKVPLRERITVGVFWLLLYFTLSIDLLASGWNLFLPGLPAYAVAYFPIALFLMTAYRAWLLLDRGAERAVTISAFALALLFAIVQKLDLSYTVTEGKSEIKIPFVSDVTALWLPLLFTAIYTALLLLVIRQRDGKLKRSATRLLTVALLATTIFELFASTSETMKLIDKDEGYPDARYLSAYETSMLHALDALPRDEVWRVALLDARIPNEHSLYGFSSLADLDSELLLALGVTLNEDGSLQDVVSPLSLSLLGVRYLISRTPIELEDEKGNTIPDEAGELPEVLAELYEVKYHDDHVTVYENPYVVPVFATSNALASVHPIAGESPFDAVNRLYSLLLGEAHAAPYAAVAARLHTTNAEISTTETVPGHTVYVPKLTATQTSASVNYSVTVEKDGPLFLSFPTDYPTELEVRVDSSLVGILYEEPADGEEQSASVMQNALFLGNYEEGDILRVSLIFGKNEELRLYLKDDVTPIVQIDHAAALAAEAALRAETETDYEAGAQGISLRVCTEQDGFFFSSLMSRGEWYITLDGKEVTLLPSDMICFELPAGEHTIGFMRVAVSPSPLPMVLSFCGIFLLLALAWFERFPPFGERFPLSILGEVKE